MLNKRLKGRNSRKNLNIEEHKEYSCKICQKVQEFINDKKVIMLYNAIDGEVNVDSLQILNKTVLYPRVEKDNLVAVKSEIFKCGAYSIREPIGEPFIGEIDVVIVPMCAFDNNCNRLGFGKGYYDRFLQNKDCLKIGVAFSCQKTENILIKETDVKMDFVITENEVVERVQ